MAAFSSYWLVKFLPLWTLALLGVTVAYFGPLVYISNKEFVDEQIGTVKDLIDAQTAQVREMAESQTAHATGVVKQYVSDYRAKAHDYVVSTRSRQASPEMEHARPGKAEAEAEPKRNANVEPQANSESKSEPTREPEPVTEPAPAVKQSDFPDAPQQEPAGESNKEQAIPDLLSA